MGRVSLMHDLIHKDDHARRQTILTDIASRSVGYAHSGLPDRDLRDELALRSAHAARISMVRSDLVTLAAIAVQLVERMDREALR